MTIQELTKGLDIIQCTYAEKVWEESRKATIEEALLKVSTYLINRVYPDHEMSINPNKPVFKATVDPDEMMKELREAMKKDN